MILLIVMNLEIWQNSSFAELAVYSGRYFFVYPIPQPNIKILHSNARFLPVLQQEKI